MAAVASIAFNFKDKDGNVLSGQTLPLDAGGNLPVSFTAQPLPTGAATAAKQAAPGTAGAASADVLSVQGVAGGVAAGVDTVVRATATSRSGTIAAGGTAQQLAAANAVRRGFSIQNQSSGPLYFSGTGAATLDQNSFLLNAGEYFESSPHHTGVGALSIIGATTGQAFYAREF